MEEYQVRFKVTPTREDQRDGPTRLKQLLKFALRACGLRCLDYREVKDAKKEDERACPK